MMRKPHESKHTGNKKRMFSMMTLIVVLLVAVVLTNDTTFSRYTSSASGEDGARVAAYVLDVRENKTLTNALNEIKLPGDHMEYTFTVANNRGGIVGEVKTNYTVTFEAYGSLPLTYTLTDSEGNAVALTKIEGTGYNAEASGVFSAAVAADHVYTLVVTWPEDQNDPKYASGSGIASLRITVQAEQAA